jgi:hypothetical protein
MSSIAPYADTLREGVHGLRVRFRHVNYRMLYFFHGGNVVVLTHGLTKEKEIPGEEIDRALRLRKKFEGAPQTHTFKWEL